MSKLSKTDNEKWIIDTDPGVDDSFAILLASTCLKENLLALSIANGNVGIDGCYINAKKICAIKNINVPIYKGVYNNLSNLKFEASDFHGKDGLMEINEYQGYEKKYDEKKIKEGNQKEESCLIDKISPLKIIELSYKHSKNLNILAIAPLTNLAMALMLDPSLPERINRIVIMGGSYSSLGNFKSNTEFNFASDPIAAKKIFSSFNKANNEIILYPWETCVEYLIKKEQLKLIGKFDSETKNYVERIIHKKDLFPENGIFADFGSAVYMINNESLKKSMKRFVDISIDSDDSTYGQFIIENNYKFKSCKNESYQSTRKKIEIITNLDQDIYYDSFIKMSEN